MVIFQPSMLVYQRVAFLDVTHQLQLIKCDDDPSSAAACVLNILNIRTDPLPPNTDSVYFLLTVVYSI